MLDAFIIESLNSIGMPPAVATPPSLTRSWDHQEVTSLQREVDAYFLQRAQKTDEWLKRAEEFARNLDHLPSDAKATPQQMDGLNKVIADLDAKAADWVVQCCKYSNQSERDLKSTRMSVDRRALFRKVLTQGEEIDGKVLQGLLDYAWAIRTMRAQVSPDKGTGPTFENADDLERFLASA